MDLWNNETPLVELGFDVPRWIVDREISPQNVAAIVQGGCASGAYMPAVTYHRALETMAENGDGVLDYIEQALGEVPMPQKNESWSVMACHFLSLAVELWAASLEGELEDMDEAA